MREHSMISLSIRQACDATSLGRTTVYELIKAGRLRVVRVGGRTLVPIENLRALISEEDSATARVGAR